MSCKQAEYRNQTQHSSEKHFHSFEKQNGFMKAVAIKDKQHSPAGIET
jgi:hypothetical protein